ncbi:alpha-mannosidase [Paenibacillus sp. FSL P4-0081]|uniref:alpha-mannosidase n=1 Tax=Paenibacillus sp. FSL P4-0081 TaxID=1536769 RepID=UPI0004F77161|nr:alpha-mannosidase [Paenibacillus sp. FSL P4-0081]AIQ31239.1 alpha-mannosidase [Paenibacillus sp. FSL P4-0081]
MDKQQTAHIISHTHWDREWYLPYERHHLRLIRLVDSLLDTLEQNPGFRSFFFDGQTIIIEDYLQVRPENRERLERHIREGRIYIGPWYILQDAFLTSPEANVRNLQIGHQDAGVYGEVSKIGYFPDTFGLTGQIPQLMVQAGITNAFFGRGVKPTGFNNTVSGDGYESSFSELVWEGPDGSKVLGILFANWYSNGNEIPAEAEEAKTFWERKLADARQYAATDQLLFMNGCDHQPLQTDLPEAIRTAEQLYPEISFVHSNFADYIKAVQHSLAGRSLSTVKGELRSQRTDGWGTLVNTASARVYLKQLNQRGQALLEKVAEPLAVIARLHGGEYPQHLLTYAWKTLLQNHPHDSICGCSVDEVHREMVTRFDKSRHTAEGIMADSMQAITGAVDTSGFARFGEAAIPLVVMNTSGWSRTGTVSVELDAARLYLREGHTLEETARRMKAVDLGGRVLVDELGNEVPCTIQDLGLSFGYDLPDDRFRQPYSCRKVQLIFEAADVPALGLRTYAWVRPLAGAAAGQSGQGIAGSAAAGGAATNGTEPRAGAGASVSLVHGGRILENESLRVEIMADGSFTLEHKPSGKVYRDLGVYENTGDIGNEYMYRQPAGEVPLTTRGLTADIRIIEDAPYRASIEIVHEWEIPASADAVLEEEQRALVYYPERQAQRSADKVLLKLRTVLRLERSGKGLEVKSYIHNTAKDHRLRMLFPADLAAASHRVDSMFELAERPNEPAPEWLNPSNAQHQQSFVDVAEEHAGLTVANLGLHEYEILRDGRNTIAITLLRCVGEMGDWGWFPTPEAQCQGEHTAELLLIPHSGDAVAFGAAAAAYQFQIPWTCAQAEVHTGTIPAVYSAVRWSGTAAAFSSLKMNEESGDLLLRWFNMTGQPCEMKLETDLPATGFYTSNVLEAKVADIAAETGRLEQGGANTLRLQLDGHEILTVGIRLD